MRLNGITRLIAKNLLGGRVFGEASWDNAQSYLEHAVAIEPNRITHRLDLAAVYADRDRTAKAREQYEMDRAARRSPTTTIRNYKEDAARAARRISASRRERQSRVATARSVARGAVCRRGASGCARAHSGARRRRSSHASRLRVRGDGPPRECSARVGAALRREQERGAGADREPERRCRRRTSRCAASRASPSPAARSPANADCQCRERRSAESVDPEAPRLRGRRAARDAGPA